MHRVLNLAILLVVFVTFINALVFFGLGVYYSILVYVEIINGGTQNHPGLVMIESLDRFLIGFVFIIFSVGLSRLFLSDASFLKSYDLPWLKITEFAQLKSLLISALLVALFVAWTPAAINVAQQEHSDWTVMIFPGCLVLVALAAKFIKDAY
ncbi:MAG TPA: YqhA family protein [Saprospiraceae bacterium]|nr:YqhA family protein [Saprospiraceae bacterium]